MKKVFFLLLSICMLLTTLVACEELESLAVIDVTIQNNTNDTLFVCCGQDSVVYQKGLKEVLPNVSSKFQASYDYSDAEFQVLIYKRKTLQKLNDGIIDKKACDKKFVGMPEELKKFKCTVIYNGD